MVTQAEANETSRQIERLTAEYEAHMHGMQSGVAQDLFHDNSSGLPKHLRVGVNSAMVSDNALAMLLIEKGVFTKLEYVTALAAAAKMEKERYEEILSKRMGAKITLA